MRTALQKLFLILTVLVCSLPAVAVTSFIIYEKEYEVGYEILDETHVAVFYVTAYNSNVSVTIPKTVQSPYTGENYTVSRVIGISDGNILSVKLPESVSTIDENAFYNSINLQSINLPKKLQTVGKNAFARCEKIVAPIYNDYVFAFLPKDYKGAYSIPEGIKTLAQGAIQFCNGLTSLTIPASLTKLPETWLLAYPLGHSMEEYIVAAGHPSLSSEDGVLYNKNKTELICYPACKKAKVYNMPETVVKTGPYALRSQYLEALNIPASLKEIFDISGPSMTTINVDPMNEHFCIFDGVLYSKDMTILYCYPGASPVTTLRIPEGITTIPVEFAYKSKNLTEVILPTTVNTIQALPFVFCEKLTSVVCLATTPPEAWWAVEDSYYKEYLDAVKFVVKVPAEALEPYKSARGWWQDVDIVALTDDEMAPLGIASPAVSSADGGRVYSLQGIEVGEGYKGIAVKGGKKVVMK